MKLHLPEPGMAAQGHVVSWCGQTRRDPTRLVDDPALATCQSCLAQLDRDLAPEPEIPHYVRTRAYGRATSALRERHRDEFDALLAEHLPLVAAEDARSRAEYEALKIGREG